MSRPRHLWDEIMLAVKGSFAVFSGVGLNLIDDSPVTSKIRPRDECRSSSSLRSSSTRERLCHPRLSEKGLFKGN